MGPSTEPRFAVYQLRGRAWPLITCPHDQLPPDVYVAFTGTQAQCERYIRDLARTRKLK